MKLYYKSAQPVPGKGEAWTIYEADEQFNILRYLTYIPVTGEIDCIAKPLVKKMSNMHGMERTDEEEFLRLWVEPDDGDGGSGDHEPTGEAGMTYFSPDMTIAEAMSVHPRVAEVFAAFRLGGCGSCGISQLETIEQVTAGYGVDVDMMLEVLEELMQSKTTASGGD